jgi:hypothetical protein
MQTCNKSGFSHGPFVYAAEMRFAPQETRMYLVTAVTAERRSFVSGHSFNRAPLTLQKIFSNLPMI